MTDPGALQRRVTLPHDRVLTIRPVERGDVDGLEALYAGLDAPSRSRRFFSKHRPSRAFFERMTTVEERGGARLVAVATDPAAPPDRVVAEAGYELLANGNGELAMAVDAGWRGWLGPYLLDALVEAAAARGVPNIEADALVSNGPMLAILRSRGVAVLPRDDWTTMRVVFGTCGRTPTWPAGHDRPRVLVEGAGGHWGPGEQTMAAGMEVLICPGPARRTSPCPALTGEPCPLAAAADVIVVAHPGDDPGWGALRAAHPALHPGAPVCVQLPCASVELSHEPGAGPEETLVPPGPAAEVVAVVRRLVSGGDARSRDQRP